MTDAAAPAAFNWNAVAADLETDLEALNLGALATEHQITQGRGSQDALVWVPLEGAPRRVTYGELTAWSGKIANMLSQEGIGRGDRVLFLLPVVPELFAGVLGALRAGAAVGAIGGSPELEYLRKLVAVVRPRAFVTVSSLKPAVAALRRKAPDLRRVFFFDRHGVRGQSAEEGEIDWVARIEGAAAEFSTESVSPSDPGLLFFPDTGTRVSGISHLAALPLFHTARSVLDMKPGERVLSIGMPGEPHFLTYSVLAPLLAGTTHLVLEDPVHFLGWSAIAAEHRPSAWFSSFRAIDVMVRVDPGLGTLLSGCRNLACTWPYDSHFVAMTAGSYGSPIHAAWTEPELGSIQCAERRGSPLRPGSVGRAVPGAEVRLVDRLGNPLGADATGRLAVRLGPSAPFAGYLDGSAPAKADGWFVTERVAKIDADGYVWIRG